MVNSHGYWSWLLIGTWASHSLSLDAFQFVEPYPVITMNTCKYTRLCHLIFADLGLSVCL